MTHETDIAPAEVIRLWPDGAPTKLEAVGPEVEYRGPVDVDVNAKAVTLRNVSESTLSVFRPVNANGVGVIVCPGGGWRILSWEHEGTNAVRWLTAHGYTAFLFKYRVRGTPLSQTEHESEMKKLVAAVDSGPKGRNAPRSMSDLLPESYRAIRDAAADDARRAIAIVRERARAWGVDRSKLGMLGFSVAACIVTDVALDPRAEPLALVAPIYGGEAQRPVPVNAPPLFAAVTNDDYHIYRMVEGLYSAWTDAERSAELHVYRRGGHGFGLVKRGLPCDGWIDRFHEWLTDLGFA